MCYNASQLAEKIYKDAVRLGASEEELDMLLSKIEEAKQLDNYHKAGYDHPILHAFEYENDTLHLNFHRWGLIPGWIKSDEDAKSIWNKTLNARGETIFEKPSYKASGMHSRCIVPLDGYFEHHHIFNKTFPFYIHAKNEERLFVAGLTSKWNSPNGELIATLAIVTSKATLQLAEIHNNPAMKEARMPLILNDQEALTWLRTNDKEQLSELVKPNSYVQLDAHTVGPLSGKLYKGNDSQIIEERHYTELDEPLTLF